MSEDWPITDEGVLVIQKKYEVFDFKKLYGVGKTWAGEYLYNWHEQLYNDKVGSAGHEIEIEWTFDKKFSAFVKFHIEVKMHILRMNPVSVEGKSLEKGEVEITIQSVMQMDYKENWEKNKLHKFLRHAYIYLVKKTELEKTAGEVWKETYDLQDKIKGVLEQYTR